MLPVLEDFEDFCNMIDEITDVSHSMKKKIIFQADFANNWLIYFLLYSSLTVQKYQLKRQFFTNLIVWAQLVHCCLYFVQCIAIDAP